MSYVGPMSISHAYHFLQCIEQVNALGSMWVDAVSLEILLCHTLPDEFDLNTRWWHLICIFTSTRFFYFSFLKKKYTSYWSQKNIKMIVFFYSLASSFCFKWVILQHLLFSCLVVSLCTSMDCSTPGFPVLHCLLGFAQTHVHWVSDNHALQHICLMYILRL